MTFVKGRFQVFSKTGNSLAHSYVDGILDPSGVLGIHWNPDAFPTGSSRGRWMLTHTPTGFLIVCACEKWRVAAAAKWLLSRGVELDAVKCPGREKGNPPELVRVVSKLQGHLRGERHRMPWEWHRGHA